MTILLQMLSEDIETTGNLEILVEKGADTNISDQVGLYYWLRKCDKERISDIRLL